MNLVLHEVSDAFLTKLDEFNFTPYIREKFYKGGFAHYSERRLYENKGDIDCQKHYVYFLMNSDEEIIAYRYLFFNPKTTSGELFSIAVDPKYRGKGYAKEIIHASIKLLADEGTMEIVVPLVKNEEPFYILEKFYRVCEREYPQIKFNIRLCSGG